jgi:FkbM family methyltransferase
MRLSPRRVPRWLELAWMRTRAFIRLLRRTRNPLPIFLDYVGMQKRPYLVRTRDRLVCEIRPGSSDRYVFYEVLVRNDYLRQGQTINRGGTVIDVGANIGCFSMLAAKRVGPTGRVIAAEPAEAAYGQLCRNLALNAVSNVTPIRAAVGAKDGKARFHVHGISTLSSLHDTVDGHETGARIVEVQVVSLETLFETTGVEYCDYMKIDCEGEEYAILDSMTPALASRIGQITLEVHHIADHEPADIHERLVALGFEIVPGQLLYGRRPPRGDHSGERA